MAVFTPSGASSRNAAYCKLNVNVEGKQYSCCSASVMLGYTAHCALCVSNNAVALDPVPLTDRRSLRLISQTGAENEPKVTGF
jgi:hypothetical protein